MAAQEDRYLFGYSSGWLSHSKYEETLASLQTEAINPVSAAFSANMMRVRNLCSLVPEVAFWTRVTTRIADVARTSLGRENPLPGRVRGAAPADPELLAEFSKLMGEWGASRQPPAQFAGEAWQDGCDLLRGFADPLPDHHGQGVSALLSSLINMTWGAVETALIDALILAINLHPEPLALRIFGEEQSYSLKLLRSHGFDLNGKMGEMGRDKMGLTSYGNITSSYRKAFKDDKLNELFEKHDDICSEHEAVRHLFTHRGGVADKKFVARARKSQRLRNLKQGETLHVDGNMVSLYSHHSVDCAAGVLKFVDGWLHARGTA